MKLFFTSTYGSTYTAKYTHSNIMDLLKIILTIWATYSKII